MKKSNDLMVLIRSLTKSEKIYFKLFAGRNKVAGNRINIKLFDVLDKSGEDPEDAIKAHFINENFLKQLKVYKHRLYDLILRGLTEKYTGKSIDSQLRDLINRIEVLYNKGLYENSRKIVIKAKEAAYKYEKYILLLEIIRWEKKIIGAGLFDGVNETYLSKLYEEEHLAISKINNINDYWKINSDMLLHYRIYGEARTKEDIAIYDNIKEKSLLIKKEEPFCYEARYYSKSCEINYCLGIDNIPNTYNSIKDMIAFYESYPEQIPHSIKAYTNTKFNLLKTTLELQKYKEYFETIMEINAISNKYKFDLSESTSSYITINTYGWKLVAYLRTGNFDQALSLVSEIEKELKYKQNKAYESVFQELFAILFFCIRDFSTSLKWINKLLNSQKTNLWQDLFCKARVLQLIIHYEIGNNDLLPYLIKSVCRSLMNKRQLYKTDHILIEFLRAKINKINSKNDLIVAFRELLDKLSQLCQEDPFERKLHQSSIIIPWVQSKVENRPMGEIMCEISGFKNFTKENSR